MKRKSEPRGLAGFDYDMIFVVNILGYKIIYMNKQKYDIHPLKLVKSSKPWNFKGKFKERRLMFSCQLQIIINSSQFPPHLADDTFQAEKQMYSLIDVIVDQTRTVHEALYHRGFA